MFLTENKTLFHTLFSMHQCGIRLQFQKSGSVMAAVHTWLGWVQHLIGVTQECQMWILYYPDMDSQFTVDCPPLLTAWF